MSETIFPRRAAEFDELACAIWKDSAPRKTVRLLPTKVARVKTTPVFTTSLSVANHAIATLNLHTNMGHKTTGIENLKREPRIGGLYNYN